MLNIKNQKNSDNNRRDVTIIIHLYIYSHPNGDLCTISRKYRIIYHTGDHHVLFSENKLEYSYK